MTVGLLIAFGLFTSVGSTMLIDAWVNRRRHPSLAERLAPFSGSVGDEAEAWLRS